MEAQLEEELGLRTVICGMLRKKQEVAVLTDWNRQLHFENH